MQSRPVAKVALAAAIYAIDRPYDYLIPPELTDRVCPGVRVLVPFGRGSRTTDGIVLDIADGSQLKQLKPVLTVLDDEPLIDRAAISLALYLSRQCFCTVYDAVRVLLPAGAWFALRDGVSLLPGIDRERAYDAAGRSAGARHLVELLFAHDGRLGLEQIYAAFGTKSPNAALNRLTEQGVIERETLAKRGVADKTEKVATLAMPPEEALAQLAGRRKTAPLRYAVVELLAAVGRASTKELCYFTGASPQTVRALEKAGFLTLERQAVFRRLEPAPHEPAPPIVLNGEQQAAFEALSDMQASGKPCAALLYGVTGSGKTQVYIKLIQSVLDAGRSALVMVPEIALTPQLLRIFLAHFGDNVAVLHSSLRATERYDEWKRVRAGMARVVLGTRSAVFAPLQNLGVLIIDEEQEYTYKSEQVPRYHARDVARYRCATEGALLVLGSATPSIETMHRAETGLYRCLTLSTRYNQRALPEVLIADMKRELQAGNTSDISELLRSALRETILKGEQSILFLNRRGANRLVSCMGCGYIPGCPRCSVSLTYHAANNRLMCHHCGHSQPLPAICPECTGRLEFVGTGTQKVEQTLKTLFPDTEILRMDADTVNAAHPHEKLLAQFEQARVPILLGTQMVAKGLDFPNVTLVGVINADASLYADDFRAAERTFSLLTQVVGRAGRGARTGRAIIQTLTPDHEVIACAARQDYDSFYRQEIHLRALRRCPPFADLFVFTAAGPEESAALRACHRLRRGLEQSLNHAAGIGAWNLLGPAAAAVAKVNNRYRYRLTLAGENSKALRALLAHVLRAAQLDKENRGVSIFADCNPVG